jgi:putative endonuclease
MDNSVFYVGVTNDLTRRVLEHKIHKNDGFTSKYNITKLVYFEIFSNIFDAIKREKQLKHYKRLWKANLITKDNPDWNDLSSQIGITKEMIVNAKQSQEGVPVPIRGS